MLKWKKKGLVGAVLVLAAFCCLRLFGCNVYAEEVPAYRLNISPTHIDLDLKPGTTTKTKFKIMNTGANAFDYEVSFAPYSVSGEEYEQDISHETSYTDLVKWISVDKETGSMEPGDEVDIEASIKVPSDVPAGGQYATILVKMIEGESGESSGIVMEKQVGTVIYASVDGETRKSGNILENRVPSFMFTPPISVTSVVENTGNIHEPATYTLQVFPLFGDEEVYTNEENPDTKIILPETKRVNTLTWDGSPHLGIFRVKQTVKFLGEESVTEKVVFICPIWFLFIILVLIFLIVFWIVSRVRGRKE